MVERGIAVPEVLMRQCRIRFESQSYLDWESPSYFFPFFDIWNISLFGISYIASFTPFELKRKGP